MLWAADSGHTNNWNNNAWAAINAGATHILGFNEPDLSTQSNLSPSAAAAAWKYWIQPFAGAGVKLVSPAVTNGMLSPVKSKAGKELMANDDVV